MEAGAGPLFLSILMAMIWAVVAAIYKSYRLVGHGRKAMWTFVLVGLVLAAFQALAELQYLNPLWLPGTTVFCYLVLVPVSRFVGTHRRPD